MTPAIYLENVRKSFGSHSVLRGISGSIGGGKVVGILGRNGEGKTTLFRVMLDILSADSGRLSIMGLSPDGTARIRLKVGYIPERPAFHAFMKVGEVFRLRKDLFPTWNPQKASEISRQIELDPNTAIKGASKGTLAKVAWVCAAAHNPKVLLLDEPTSGLDMVVRDSVMTQLVREMAEEGKTILVANHHMEEFFGVLDEIWILSGGVIEGKFTMDQLRHDAFRITGRWKSKSKIIPPGVVQELGMGDLVQWIVTDKETLYRVRQQDLLENFEQQSLPLEITLKTLLAQKKAPI